MRIIFICFSMVTLLLGACAGFEDPQPAQVLPINPISNQPLIEESYGLKKKVAVGRFTNDTRIANSFLNEGNDNRESLSRAANDILSAKLAQTNKFLLIERYDQVSITNEQQISDIQTYQIPADYLILGSISEYGRNVTGNVGLLDRSKKQTAFAKVTLRIVDTHTGMVIYGEEGSGEASSETASVLGMGSTAGYDDTLTDKAIDAAISSVINNLINKISNDTWKSYVLNYENNDVFISGGEMQGVKVGDEFTVYQRGKVVTNPQTKIPIELPGTKIARVKIEQLISGNELTEISIGKIIEGNLVSSEISNYYISDK
ncbi:MAG TPA: CsgG/HfaB family protein [Candidatus Syntrophosphaera sp.]|nr:CsgG/HfaB family protein [Candidatus Syntrophosphaera sp.]HPH60809.1 CsgG/HfaB family protein [Candidatus Syntrophosphaera sp.]